MPKSDTSSAATTAAPKVTRNQQVVLTAPPTVAAMTALVQPALERLPADAVGVQLLVLVPDADTALAVAQSVLPAGDAAPVLVPVTSAGRAARQLATTPKAVIGAPSDLAALLPSGLLKLEQVAQLFVLQADLTLSLTDEAAITALMTEVPKDCARTVTMAAETDAVTAFAKSYMKRPRRVGDDVVADGDSPISLQYVLVSAASRTAALRRVLDAANAPSTIVVASDAAQLADASAALRALGYGADADVQAVTGAVTTHSTLRVLYDVPATRGALEAALGGNPVQTIALVAPRQVSHLRALLGGGSLTSFVLPDTMAKAVGRDGARLGELRKVLADGVSARELAALEPLMEEHDAMEIAAAALRLLERERETAQALRVGVTTAQPKEVKRALAAASEESAPAPAAVAAPSVEQAPAPAAHRDAPTPEYMVLWFNIGSDDGATNSSFVGAITGESGLDRSVIGTIEMRGNHTLVEVAGAHAEQIVNAMTGSIMRSRQVMARIDGPGPLRSQRGAPRGGRGDRPSGGFSRDRGDRPSGGFSRDRGDRPTGGFSRDRGDRPARPAFRRDEGGAPRGGGFRRDDAERPAFSRDDRPRGGFSRGPREGGFSREDRPARPPRDGGFSRDDRGGARGPRPGGFSRDERPARGGFSRGPREGGVSRGFTRDRDDAPRGPRTDNHDFAERAERLRNSRRSPRTED